MRHCLIIFLIITGNAYLETTVYDNKTGQWFGATLSSSGETDGPVVVSSCNQFLGTL